MYPPLAYVIASSIDISAAVTVLDIQGTWYILVA